MGLAVGDIVALTYEGIYDAQQIRSVFHWRVTTAGTSTTPEADLQAMADNFALTTNTLTNALQAVLVDTFAMTAVDAQRVSPQRTIRLRKLSSFPGGIAADGLPTNSAVVLTKRTLTAGRMGIGSLHLTAVERANVVNSALVTITAYTTLATQMAAGRTVTAVGLGIDPGLYNPSLPPTFFSRIFDVQVQTSIRTMRRRTLSLGI